MSKIDHELEKRLSILAYRSDDFLKLFTDTPIMYELVARKSYADIALRSNNETDIKKCIEMIEYFDGEIKKAFLIN